MSKSPRYTLIGLFVVGACCLAVAALLFIGGGRMFSTKKAFVAYFSGSLKGLTLGAPVNFRGVRVGTVSDISVVLDDSRTELNIPVTFEIQPGAVRGISPSILSQILSDSSKAPLMDRLIQRGLRAQLVLDSLVTGQLYIALDFYPGTEPNFSGRRSDHPEIPTIESSFEKFKSGLEKLPIQEISMKLVRVLEKVDKFLEEGHIASAVSDFKVLAEELTHLAKNLDQRSLELTDAVKSFAQDTKGTLKKADGAFTAVEATADPTRRTLQDLAETLREVTLTARSLRQLSDSLERHPESLIRGKR